jgi:hypothetical protein
MGTTAEAIRLPAVTDSRRRDPERVALGDTVTIEDGPQLHQHLSEKVPGQTFGIGTAIHPGTTVALGLGIDAAILAVNGKKLGISMLRYCSFTMERRVSIDRPLRATGRVAELGARHVECVAEVWQDDHVVCKARVGLCQVRDGRATPLARYYLTDAAGASEP